ncbi:MAG TPA: M48 family metallopeptidase [Paludibacteraceae bacterium]|nr:M48 family metallopeptidase [Paludibacteraceae bacterium]HPT42225.1 M48 family metallopeptidase [Paludibacteraceae bacterium]
MLEISGSFHPMISDKDLGTITFRRSTRTTRISVRILSNSLVVTLPPGSSETDALKFIDSVRPKLIKKQSGVNQKTVVISESNILKTCTFDVCIRKAERNNIFSSLKSGVLTIEYPQQLNPEEMQTQTYFWNSINYFLRMEAKRILPQRTRELADQYGFSFTDVKIQSSKTRWGSCNTRKNINLSFYLMLLPFHLIDYVILHELCHTREMNHSENFWHQMDLVTNGSSKKLRNEMKQYSMPK